MKKLLAFLLASALIAGTFTGCKKENQPQTESTPEPTPEPTYVYQDGTYSVSYAVPASDRTLDYLTVTIEKDQITIDEYGSREDDSAAGGSEETSSEAATSSSAASETATSSASESASSGEDDLTEHEENAAQAAQLILAAFEEAGQDVDKMQPVEGAEEHSYRFMRMMRTVFEFAEAGDTTPVILGKYADGSYESVMPDFNPGGWQEYVSLTVKDGLVSEIKFDARNEEGVLITEDAEQNPEGSSDTPSVYYPKIAQNFLDAGGDLDAVETPTNGAQAMKSFKKLMKPLLASMLSAGDTDVVASMYVDGTYKASFKDFDENGWKDYIVVDIQNDVVNIREFDAVNQADETKLKSQDSEMAAKMQEKNGLSPADFVPALIQEWEAADNDILAVDNIAGATVSSNNFKLLLGELLATAAIEGDTEATLEVERVTIEEPEENSSQA